ncbi:MAG TPA: ferredoxin [Acidimicrobiales bacterium]|nr:ferredoxin [Acidimicrobiales bacterium]
MRIVLDSTRCQGHGRCYGLSPELFDTDDEGYAVLKVTGDVPVHLEEDARIAADNCPEYAIATE